MSRELFGTDGVRGPAGEYPLDFEGTDQIGAAAGDRFAPEGGVILIGVDPRESSHDIADGLAHGMTRVGADVEFIGTIPTPGLAYVTRETGAVAGTMVTASHNIYTDNGVKIFDGNGDKLSDDTESAINHGITNGVANRDRGFVTVGDDTAVKMYEDFLVGSAEGADFEGMRIGLDTANGAASGIAERVFTRLGAEVTPMFDDPDGQNINADCGATHPEALQKQVLKDSLHLGAAFDGDADRLVMVDEQGREFNGDHIMYTLGVSGRHTGVVATVMSNLGMEQALNREGITLHRAGVGDRYVLEGLGKTGFTLGGEQSGHIILPELLATGDGMLAAIQTIRAVRESGLTLAEWRDQVTLLPQKLVNISVPDKSLLGHEDAQAYIADITDQLGDEGRVLIRTSGTENLVRVMIESPNALDEATAAAAGLKTLLHQLAGVR